MASLAITVAGRMGTRAGALWRTTRTPIRNPFRHPAMAALAREWRRAFVAAATER